MKTGAVEIGFRRPEPHPRIFSYSIGGTLAALSILVDYDNVDKAHLRAGPINLAKLLSSLIPVDVLSRHSAIDVRLYGGWRSKSNLTRAAQQLVPDIGANSPAVVSYQNGATTVTLRVTVALALKPIGGLVSLDETLVKDRGIRKFRATATPWSSCSDRAECGFSNFFNVNYSTRCATAGCGVSMGDIFVRDEQKMVDTLLVADIAHLALSAKSTDIVLVSSDVDMWPGVLLALGSGCSVVHIHTKRDWRTQRHLINTLPPLANRKYTQLSV